ncbi:MAG: STAS-like domain-containing protein [Sarcina sp.]
MNINVREFLGEDFSVEDAIILRNYIKENLNNDVELDFSGVERISTTFLTCLFTELINKLGRESIIKKIYVKNLSNYRDYSRVVRGTTFN